MSSVEDASAKDELVKQHMKIAEEAIAGWEKAEAETAELKEKLEAALEQKLATEDRVSHLDGALKECMKQLRHVREEQEQKIHEALVKKTREWEIMRTDLEARLEDAANELCEALAENQAMTKSLQERAKTISDLSDLKTKLEAENNVLKDRLAHLEKENSRFKYELHVVNKELEHRNEERESSKRASEIASKNSFESSKKITKLEEECQRLKLLLKKRTQNTASISPEVPVTDKNRRKSSPFRRSTTSLPLKSADVGDYGLEENVREENRVLTVRLQSLQDEAKSLRDLLAKKDHELQSARLMCAKTANKLSLAEEQLETRSCSCFSTKSGTVTLQSRPNSNVNVDPSVSSVSGESGADDVCAESWASALIAELAHFKKDNKSSVCDSLQASLNFDIMDDFAEMEKLASLSSSDESEKIEKLGKSDMSYAESADTLVKSVQKQEDSKCNVQPDELSKSLKEKLADVEAQLSTLQAKQTESDTTICQLQKMLVLKFEIQAEGALLRKAAEAARCAIQNEEAPETKQEASPTEIDGGKMNSWSDGFNSQLESTNQGTSDLDFAGAGAELAAAVRKVLDIVEGIGQTDYSFPYSQWISGPALENDEDHEFDSPRKQWRSSGLDACVESLINLCNSLVQGKVDIIDFIAEVASALDWLVGLIFAVPDKSPLRSCNQRHVENCKEQTEISDSDLPSARSSPTQIHRNGSDVEEGKTTEQHDVLPDQSSVSNLSFQCSESSTHEEDLSKLASEHAVLKMTLEAETKKANKYESEILRLKVVNEQLEHNHATNLEKLADLDSQVQEANQIVQKLQSELLESEKHASELKSCLDQALNEKESLEKIVGDLENAKSTLKSELCSAKETVEALGKKIADLETELDEEVKCRKEMEMQLLQVKQEQERLQGEAQRDSSASFEDEATRIKKEQEIAAAAEKLALCQQTILDLGKQLQALGVSKNIVESPLNSQLSNKAISGQQYEQATLPPFDLNDDKQYSDDSRELTSSRIENNRKQEKSKASKVSGGLLEGEPNTPGPRKAAQTNGRHSRQPQPLDYSSNYKGYNNRFPSPTHGDISDSSTPGMISSEPVVSSPLRSPARFLSLRKNASSSHETSKHGENETGEKHGSSGFSRFFGRTKSSH